MTANHQNMETIKHAPKQKFAKSLLKGDSILTCEHKKEDDFFIRVTLSPNVSTKVTK